MGPTATRWQRQTGGGDDSHTRQRRGRARESVCGASHKANPPQPSKTRKLRPAKEDTARMQRLHQSCSIISRSCEAEQRAHRGSKKSDTDMCARSLDHCHEGVHNMGAALPKGSEEEVVSVRDCRPKKEPSAQWEPRKNLCPRYRAWPPPPAPQTMDQQPDMVPALRGGSPMHPDPRHHIRPT